MTEETKLILKGLKILLRHTNLNDEECEVYVEIKDSLNPKEEQSLPSKTADALRGK